eukprot:2472475-Ditylum_brightwellii.AAC.1
MRISHGTRKSLTLASQSAWAVFKTNKMMKMFLFQRVSNHPSVVGIYMTVLVAKSELRKVEKLNSEIAKLRLKSRQWH